MKKVNKSKSSPSFFKLPELRKKKVKKEVDEKEVNATLPKIDEKPEPFEQSNARTKKEL